jgi:hypothetical protein
MQIKVFGPKREKVTGEWRRRCNEELPDLYSTPNVIGVIGFEAGGRYGGEEKFIQGFGGRDL